MLQLGRYRLSRIPSLAQPRIHSGPDLGIRPICMVAVHAIQYETKHVLAVGGVDVLGELLRGPVGDVQVRPLSQCGDQGDREPLAAKLGGELLQIFRPWAGIRPSSP